MEITKEIIECVYAHVPPLRGLLVPVDAFCRKAAEMYPECGITPESLLETLTGIYDSVRYMDDYREREEDAPRCAFRINNNKIPRLATLRQTLLRGVTAQAGEDGWCDAAAVIKAVAGVEAELSALRFDPPAEVFCAQPAVYEVDGGRVRLRNRVGEPGLAMRQDASRQMSGSPEEMLAAAIDAVLPEGGDGGSEWMLTAQVAGVPAIREALAALGLKFRMAVEKYHPDRYEFLNTTPDAPTAVLKMRRRAGVSRIAAACQPASAAPKKSVPKTAYDKLIAFAWFLNYNEAIEKLARKALPECWHFGEVKNYRILKSYFEITFERLMYEDRLHRTDAAWQTKIRVSADEKMAVFNTGLVDRFYDPIYAYFKRNTSDKKEQKWFFVDFVGGTDNLILQQLTRTFGSELPQPAQYYSSTSQLVYDSEFKIGSYNWDHIICDNCDRFPRQFFRATIYGFDERFASGGRVDYKALSEFLRRDEGVTRMIRYQIENAVDLALKRVRWNFRTAVPIYYPKEKIISMLLPLTLTQNSHNGADLALVLEATESGAYIAHTVLTMVQAYTDARLITRLDSGWLNLPESSLPASPHRETAPEE